MRDRVSCGRGRDLATVDGLDRVLRDCEVVTREISTDPYLDPDAQHQTEVEPDTAAVGSTVVAVFQTGRDFGGGSSNIGYAVSRDRGHTWSHGFLPRLTTFSKPAGPWPRGTDPSVAYDARQGVWLVATLVFNSDVSAIVVSRSNDGRHWTAPVTVIQAPPSQTLQLDKQWIACDNGSASPFRGRCYVTYDDLGSVQIETHFSADGGLTWSSATAGPGFPGRTSIQGSYAPGVQPVVRPDGMVVIPFFDETRLAAIRSVDGGVTWSAASPIAPARYRPHAGFRAAPLPSAEVDGAGTVYVAWADCSLRSGCAANDLLIARSADGVAWSAPVRATGGAADAELPGLAANPARAGRLALAYYTLRGRVLDVWFVSSTNGGDRWSRPQRLDSRSFSLPGIASTSQGSMVGDYISTSFAGGRAVPVFALARRPRTGRLFESMFATSLAVPG